MMQVPHHAAAGRGKGRGSSGAHTISSFPIIVTTYEMVIKDRQFLCRYDWKVAPCVDLLLTDSSLSSTKAIA